MYIQLYGVLHYSFWLIKWGFNWELGQNLCCYTSNIPRTILTISTPVDSTFSLKIFILNLEYSGCYSIMIRDKIPLWLQLNSILNLLFLVVTVLQQSLWRSTKYCMKLWKMHTRVRYIGQLTKISTGHVSHAYNIIHCLPCTPQLAALISSSIQCIF